MSIPGGVVILTVSRVLFSSYMEKFRSVLDYFWVASWRAKERSSRLSLSSCWIFCGKGV